MVALPLPGAGEAITIASSGQACRQTSQRVQTLESIAWTS